jgi:hypothetical protein
METNKKILGKINTQRCSVTLTQFSCENYISWLYLDVPQSVLETVIPKVDPRLILFVQGEHKGLVRIS